VPAAEAASHGERTTGWEPTATGYTQRYNGGTGTLTAPVVFTKYTGSTCVAVEEAICAADELYNATSAPLVLFAVEDFIGVRCKRESVLLALEGFTS